MSVESLPLCDAGRCSAILRGLAEAQAVERVVERNGEVLAAVVREFVARLDLDPAREARVPEALQAAIAAVTGGPVLDGEAA